jgi:hypothetical protein
VDGEERFRFVSKDIRTQLPKSARWKTMGFESEKMNSGYLDTGFMPVSDKLSTKNHRREKHSFDAGPE